MIIGIFILFYMYFVFIIMILIGIFNLFVNFEELKKKIRMKELYVFYSDRYNNIFYNFKIYSFFCFCLYLMFISLRFVVGVKINYFTFY